MEKTYQETILELCQLDPTDAAETAAASMLKAGLNSDEITAILYVRGVRALGTSCTRLMTGKERPADVWEAARGITAFAERELLTQVNYMAMQYKRYHPPRFTSTHDKPIQVYLLPELAYEVSCDHKNSECLTVAFGQANSSDTVTTTVAPGESCTVSGRESVWLAGGNEPVLLGITRVGGEVLNGTLAQPLPKLKSKAVPKASPKAATTKPKRGWFR